jgi:hypothetical protein
MKKLFSLFLLVAFCLLTSRAWYWATDGFRISRIEGFERMGKERGFSEEAALALSQPYFYLGRGRQCFAFQSEDGQYVIKFPRLDRYRNRLLFRACPFDLFKTSINQRLKSHAHRKEKLFTSFEISCDELQEDTAIVAMFNAPKNGKKLEITDRLGRVFWLSLENTGFILQRKLRLFRDVFQEALAKGDRSAIDCILEQFLEVVTRIADKGILSKDGSFLNNFGFDKTRCFQIDVGSFYRPTELSGNEAFAASIHASVETLRVWLLHRDPVLLECIDQKLGLIYGAVQ